MPAREQRDRRGAHRRGAALAASARPLRGASRAHDPPGQALVVQPARLVFGKAGRQDLGLPGAGRRLEAFELGDIDLERVRPLHAGIGRDALPASRKRRKSRAATGSISARSRLTV